MKPFSSFIRRVTELTRSRIYIWTTSAPARLPVLVTSTRTRVDASRRIRLLFKPEVLEENVVWLRPKPKGKERRDLVEQIAAAGRRFVIVNTGRCPAERGMVMGSFPLGIDFAKKNFGDGVAGFLAEIPALKYDRHMVTQVANGKRAAVEKKDDHRFASRKHRRDQLLLLADHFQPGAVPHVLERPGFAGSLLIAADGQTMTSACRATLNAS